MARDVFKHILVPHDFSEPAAVALRTAAQLAKQHGGKLTVLHVLVLYLPACRPSIRAVAGRSHPPAARTSRAAGQEDAGRRWATGHCARRTRLRCQGDHRCRPRSRQHRHGHLWPHRAHAVPHWQRRGESGPSRPGASAHPARTAAQAQAGWPAIARARQSPETQWPRGILPSTAKGDQPCDRHRGGALSARR